jgi:hypothetical protein
MGGENRDGNVRNVELNMLWSYTIKKGIRYARFVENQNNLVDLLEIIV